MSEVTADPAKTTEAEQPKAAAKKAAAPKTQRLRSCVGRFVILHTNTVIGEGEEKKVLVDEWVQAQINAGKLEIVVD
jgi:hypothetical protein